MSLPSPSEMPSPLPVNSKNFDLAWPQLITPVGAGFIQTIDRGPQLWSAKYSTPPLSDIREQDFQAWLDLLNGSQFTFLGWDPRKPRPWYYRNVGGTPWATGTPKVNAVNFAASTLNLQDFTAGAHLTKGDMIGFLDGNIWRLYRSCGNYVVAEDGTITVVVVPRPKPIGGTRNLRLVKAACAMKVIGGVQKTDRVEDIGPSYTFSAVQFIDRST